MTETLERPARAPAGPLPAIAVTVDENGRARPADGPPRRFALCTLVNDPVQYRALLESLERHGFGADSSEFLCIDNTAGNRLDAYRGLSLMIRHAAAEYCVLCHQDIALCGEGRDALERVLAELTARDPHWALAGNAGGTPRLGLALRITDPHGADVRRGTLPAPVASLDENFIVLRRAFGVTCSPELAGFHLYGTDLCLRAAALGLRSYVVDFHVRHFGHGVLDAAFDTCRRHIERLYTARGRIGLLRTTCTVLVFGLPPALERRAGRTIRRLVIGAIGKLERLRLV